MTTQSEQINELAAALAKAQGKITGAKKDADNPFFKSKYADLAACWDACRGPLSENGLAVIQTTRANGGGVTVITTLAHSSGQWISGELHMKPVKDDPQGYGSCLTYARRYALAAMVGLAQVDDDANAASAKGNGVAAQSVTKVMPPKKRKETLAALRKHLYADDSGGVLETWGELDNEEKVDLWTSLESDERSKIKTICKTEEAA